MRSYLDILYRISRIWVAVPPETAIYVLVALDRPEFLLVPLLWLLGFVRDYLFGLFINALLTKFWMKIPFRLRRLFIRLEEESGLDLDGSHKTDKLQQEMNALKERVSDLEQQRREDRERINLLEEKIQRAWWRRWFG